MTQKRRSMRTSLCFVLLVAATVVLAQQQQQQPPPPHQQLFQQQQEQLRTLHQQNQQNQQQQQIPQGLQNKWTNTNNNNNGAPFQHIRANILRTGLNQDVPTVTTLEARQKIALRSRPILVLLVGAEYDGNFKIAVNTFRVFCNSLSLNYICGIVDVAQDAQFQQEFVLTNLPAVLVAVSSETTPGHEEWMGNAVPTNLRSPQEIQKWFEEEQKKSRTMPTAAMYQFYGPWQEPEKIAEFVKDSAPRTCAIIPARFASTRFPHKMLRPIRGKPMIQNTYEQVARAKKIDAVWIATEGEDLLSAARKFTPRVLKTSDKPINGMERIGEAEEQLPPSCQIIVNVHGDEPFVDPNHIDAVVQLYEEIIADPLRGPLLGAASLRKRIQSEEEALNRGHIKMVLRDDGTTQYLSRALVPHSKDGKYDPTFSYWSHMNIHAFARGFATKYKNFPNPAAQLREDVEYLRILMMGYTHVTVEVGDGERDVNTEEDYKYLVEKYGQ